MNYSTIYDNPELGQDFPLEMEEELTVTVTEPEPETAQEIGTVNAREVYIRKGPGKEFETNGTVLSGEELIVFGTEKDFLKVETSDGRTGYIMQQFVTIV